MNASALLRTCACPLAILASSLPGLAAADGPNEILRMLLTTGVPIADGETVKLPEPTLADGMTAAAQRRQIEAIAEGRNSWEDLTRRTVVAPFLLRTSRDVSEQEQRGLGCRADLWFVAYGNLDTLASDEFLEGQFKTASEDADNASSARLLGDADLKKRGLPVPSEAEDPRYVAAKATLLERIQVSATTRSIKTRTAESLIVASILEPRFAGDPEFPNRWCSILRDDNGSRQLGEPHTYRGLGSFVKATRLVEPSGAILIEYHIAYAEPKEWFKGANLLQSKLPILAQTVVRKVRRSLAAR
ncbi:MAG: hypothetical protein ACLQNE_40085 [Thermoguttaceae bacterium]|jgi:hypothetical protein